MNLSPILLPLPAAIWFESVSPQTSKIRPPTRTDRADKTQSYGDRAISIVELGEQFGQVWIR